MICPDALGLVKRWRRNVEAHLFVTTLKDYFRDQYDEVYSRETIRLAHQSRTDEWALDYVGIQYLQQMREAFDQDGSGYITVQEVNRVTELLPKCLDWRLVFRHVALERSANIT